MPTILSLRDSVFTPYLASFADYEMPYPDDTSVLPRQQIERELDSLEDGFASSMRDLFRVQVGTFVDSLQPAIASGDLKAISNADWKMQPPLQQLLWGLWSNGWELGQSHAAEEIQMKSGGQFTLHNQWSAFASRANDEKKKRLRKDGFPVGTGRMEIDNLTTPTGKRRKRDMPGQLIGRRPKPDLRQVPLKGSYLEQAVNERILLLSDKMAEDTKEQIREVIRDRVINSGDGKISVAEMNARIQEILEGADDDVQGGIYARAKVIGKTETTAVYSIGRLHTYKDSGRVRNVRYQTFEYARPVPDIRPCMVCLPRNGDILNLDRDWQLIITVYLIPAHGSCRCSWMPIIEDDPDDAKAVADPGRAPKEATGKPMGEAWMGFLRDRAGNLIMSEAMKQAIAQQQASQLRQKKRQKMFAGLGLAALTLSFSGMLYLFFKHWQSEKTTAAGGRTFIPTGPDLGEVAVGLGEQLKAEAVKTASDVKNILTPGLLNQLATGAVNLNNPTVASLKALGLSQTEATRMNAFLQEYAKWLRARPSVRIGNLDINTANATQLVATGMFSLKQAAAIVAHTQKTPISSMEDLGKIRYQSKLRGGQPIFKGSELDGVMGRLQTYWLQPNLNSRSLTASDLTKRFGIRAATAEKIMAERDRGYFYSFEDLKKRLKGQVSDASLKLLQKRGMRVDFDDPLPTLELVEQKDIPLLMPAAGSQPVPLRRMIQPQQPAGQPPIPVNLTAQQQAVRDYLINTPRRLAGEASGFLGILTQAIPPDLIAAAEAYQKKVAAERKMQQAYQRYVAETATVGDQVDALEQAFDRLPQRLPNSMATDMEIEIQLLLRSLTDDTELAGRQARVLAVQEELNQVIRQGRSIQDQMKLAMRSRTLLDDNLAQQRNAILGDMNRYLRELNDPQVYQLAGDDFVGDVQQLRAVWGDLSSWLNEDRNALVRTVEERINNLSKMANSLIRDPAGAKADLSDAILRLRGLQKELEGKQIIYSAPADWVRFNRPKVLRLRQAF